VGDRHGDPIVIAGAGLAGLSLAVHLAEQGVTARRHVILLEPRAEHVPDRTWSFFDVEPHPFAHCVSHRWSRWRVRTPAGEHVAASRRHAYQHLPAARFYEDALDRLAASEGVTLLRGVEVTALTDRGDHVRVRTTGGDLRASLAFDSRPPAFDRAPAQGEVRLLQHFMGCVVRTEHAAFDPTTCTLMDFHARPGEGIHFTYVLPFGTHEALVEDTWFTADRHPRARYQTELERYMAERVTTGPYKILRTEEGVIPMTTEPLSPVRTRRIHAIGTAGGLAKPSTGYAFTFIQRHSAALARALRRHDVPRPPLPRSAWTRMLDRVFLWVLQQRPDDAPDLFLRMFRDAPTDALVRFLSESSGLADDLAVMRALPAPEFTAAAWRARHLWLRRA
jgi:lycopene beta-cyclase